MPRLKKPHLSNTSRVLGRAAVSEMLLQVLWQYQVNKQPNPAELRVQERRLTPGLSFVGYREQFTAKGWSHRIFWRKNQSNHVQHEADGRKVIPSLGAAPVMCGVFSKPEDWLKVSPRRSDRLAGYPPTWGCISSSPHRADSFPGGSMSHLDIR